MLAQIKERPILFSGAMVRALLDGSKTQTRRVMKRQPYVSHSNPPRFRDTEPGDIFVCPDMLPTSDVRNSVLVECEKIGSYHCMGQRDFAAKHSPYGQPGDRLWVRETHSFVPDSEETDGCSAVLYAADGNQCGKLRPSIHMPRWASRILLEIVSVRVERAQDISEADAGAEGALEWACRAEGVKNIPDLTNVGLFSKLWEQTYGPGSWDANPWVWVVEFKRVAR